jgi:ParB-like nuclease domain
MSAKLKITDPNFTKARFPEGRRWIGIKNLEAPDELQPRSGIDKGWVSQLAAWFKEGSQFPPAKVFQLPDARLMLAEGHHRRWALLDLGETDMLCEIVDGSMEDAIEHAACSNKSNGVKPMGPKDVTKALEMLLQFNRWWNASREVVAAKIGCSSQKVNSVKMRIVSETGRVIPNKIIRSNGRPIGSVRRTKNSREIDIVKHSREYRAHYRGRELCGASIDEVKAKLTKVFRDEDEHKCLMSQKNLNPKLFCYGFKGIGWIHTRAPGMVGWEGHGIVVVPCAFEDAASLPLSVGNVKALLIAIGQQEGCRVSVPLARRSVILCYREDGPSYLIELFERSGIEFMTLDELIRSLGAGGMTPDEVQASLKATAE